ncbi:chemotaxis protein [Rhodopseudomonas palustris]|uniref:Chemotaxis protein n=1 Tax=Rhodopseudomonas palustris TaxID=1076 RepID=A0A0D7F4Q5_RHOPL|nr:chemotaxis protein [Rhodopseudomonas palustris]
MAAIGIIGLIGVLLVGGIHLYGESSLAPIQKATDAARLTAELTGKLNVELLEARRAEKDFLARNDVAKAELQQTIVKSAVASVDALRKQVGTNQALAADVGRIGDALKAYEGHFEAVLAQKTRLGLDEKSGLEIKLRTSVHDIEKMADRFDEPQMKISMLMMRRHEKDFMMRRDGKYVDQLTAQAKKFSALIDSASLPADAKTALATKLADYQRDFLAWAETAKALGTELAAMSASFAPIEPLIESMVGSVTAARLAAEQQGDVLRDQTETQINIALAVIAMIVLGAGYLVGRSVSRPLAAMTAAMIELAHGNFDVVLPGLGRRDEIGEIADAVETFKIKAEEKAREEAAAASRQEAVAAQQRKAEMIKLADAFEGAVGEIVHIVSSASTELEASATSLTSTATRSQELATVVAASSEEASTNVQSVASATEEMASSVNEISRQVQDSARIASEAVNQAQATNDRVAELAQAATRIGDVVELINTIAGQTNLLALNATIEAARAGDAGRGFAVVAAEVKTLAEQTAKATGEISQQISGIQAATQLSVSAIKEIGDTIGRMSEIASTIAAAVEQQGAATQEISRNVQQAAQGTEQVSANITDVQRGATETGSASAQVLSSAKSLSIESNRLRSEVGRFLDTVRAA